MNISYALAKQSLYKLKNTEKAKSTAKFFKTGSGHYGEGDQFLGISVPDIRQLVKQYRDLIFDDILQLLQSKYNEEQVFGILILVDQFQKTKDENHKKKCFNFYIKNKKYLNNWNLVDASHEIVGSYLWDNPQKLHVLEKMVKSKILWDRRIAVVSTWFFIRKKDFNLILKFASLLMDDKEDLMHKAVGWMLREVGKRDEKVLVTFLEKYVGRMPRTMLRYSIERLDQKLRNQFLTTVRG